MRFSLLFLISFFIFSCSSKKVVSDDTRSSFAQTKEFTLSSPKLNVDSVLFDQSSMFTLALDHPNAEIYYTIDGSAVSKKSRKYLGRVSIFETTQIKAKSFHSDFNPSEEIEKTLFMLPKGAINMKALFLTDPHEKYPGIGSASLTDKKSGNLDFSRQDLWSGFQEKQVYIHLINNEKTKAKKLVLGVLQNHGAWIFTPIKLELFVDGACVASEDFTVPLKEMTAGVKYLSIELPEEHHSLYSLKISSQATIPSWHQGAGTAPWLLLMRSFYNKYNFGALHKKQGFVFF